MRTFGYLGTFVLGFLACFIGIVWGMLISREFPEAYDIPEGRPPGSYDDTEWKYDEY